MWVSVKSFEMGYRHRMWDSQWKAAGTVRGLSRWLCDDVELAWSATKDCEEEGSKWEVEFDLDKLELDLLDAYWRETQRHSDYGIDCVQDNKEELIDAIAENLDLQIRRYI